MRIISANLCHGRVDPDWLAELGEGLDADVVAMQEALPEHFEALSRRLPHGRFRPGDEATGLGMALRQPATVDELDLAWRNADRAVLKPADWPELEQPLELLNVHIAAPHVYRPPGYGFTLRRWQVRALERYLAGRAPGSLAMVGDFNATPLWPVYRRIAAQLTDAAVAAAQLWGRALEPTWGPAPGGSKWLRIDHGFVRSVRVVDFQVVTMASSDHAAVVLDLGDASG